MNKIEQHRRFLNEIIKHSDILEDDILDKYTDDKIINISNQLREQLTVIGVIALVKYIRKRAKKYRDEYFKRHIHECNHLTGIKKKKCIDDLKRQAEERKIIELKKSEKLCNRTSNPVKCRQLLNLNIRSKK